MQKTIHTDSRISTSKETHRETILVVDDDADILLLNKTILEMEDYEVFTAQSGSEAMALLNKISLPHLILLDMNMGEMSGIEFMRQLEQDRPDIVAAVPVVFLTGVDQVPLSKAAGFIRKPTEVTQFILTVREFIKAGYSHPVKH